MKNNKLPLNLQFFAESQENQNGENQGENTGSNETPTTEQLATKLAEMETALTQSNAREIKLKNSLDSVLKEKGELSKQLKARKTAEEQEAEALEEEKEAHKSYVSSLEKKLSLIERTDYYMDFGMSKELAKETARVEVEKEEGHEITVSSNIKKTIEAKVREKEAEMIKNRPQVNAGFGDSGAITKEQFDRMGMAEKSKLYRENKTEYDRLNG